MDPDLQEKYPDGVRFTADGCPDFKPYAAATVKAEGLTGSYAADEKVANEAIELDSTPDNWVWHHVEDGKTLHLIPTDLHNAVKHTGGAAVIKMQDKR